MTGHLGFVNGTRFDATGSRLFSVSIEGRLCVWDTDNGELVASHQLHQGPINDIDYDAGKVATAGFDGRALLVDEQGKRRWEYDAGTRLHAVALIDDVIAFGGSDGVVTVSRSEQPEMKLSGHEDAIECLAFVDDILVSGSRDRTLRIWDMSTGELTAMLEGHRDWVTRVAGVSPGEILSVGEDGLIVLWNYHSATEIWRIETGEPIWGLAVDKSSGQAYIGIAGPPQILDLKSRERRPMTGIPGFASRAISVNDRGLVALGHDDGGITLLDPHGTREPLQIPTGHLAILTVCFDDYGCVTGHANGEVMLKRAGESPVIHKAHRFMAYTALRVGDGRAAVGSLDGSISVWDTQTSQQRSKLDHRGQVFSLSQPDDSSRLLSAGDDHFILWDLNSGKEVLVVSDIGSGNHTLAAISADGRTIVSVGEDALLRVWREEKIMNEIALPFQDASAVTLTPDGGWAIVGSNDGAVGKVDLKSSDYVYLHDRHDSWIRQVLLMNDVVLSCSQNGIAVTHHLKSGEAVLLKADPVAAVGFLPDGRVGCVSPKAEVEILAPG